MQNKIKYTLRIISITMVLSFGFAFLFIHFTDPLVMVADDLEFDEQNATIRAIAKVQPAVVNIIVYDEEEFFSIDIESGIQKTETKKILKGRGTGFIINSDGYIITNKHVVETENDAGDYRIIMNSGKQYYAQLIAKDPLNDLAVLKIFDENLPFVELGDSNSLQTGSTVIAIGNALGLYQNTATKGIVSGLGRNILASEKASGQIESLDNIIQTDAGINRGNSGGPLIDLNGRVVGINVAVDETGSAIGFAIPVNDARVVINSVIENGRIIRPRLGLRYIMLSPEIAIDNKLNRTSGAWITVGGAVKDSAITKDGPASRAGLLPGDVVFEINAIKVEDKDTLLSIVQRYKPGDKIGMKVLRGEKILILIAELDEFKM
jgi:S1-C subfamily serine protease